MPTVVLIWRNSVDQFAEPATKIHIEDLFYAVSGRTFIVHQFIKLLLQFPFLVISTQHASSQTVVESIYETFVPSKQNSHECY